MVIALVFKRSDIAFAELYMDHDTSGLPMNYLNFTMTVQLVQVGTAWSIATFLEGYGRRVQKSVFECFMGLGEMQKLQAQLLKRVSLPEDNVRLYWINADAVPRTLTLGSETPTPPPQVYII